MIYLYWYLGIGVVILVVMYASHKLSSKSESDGLKGLLDAVNPERKKLTYRLINNILVPLLGAVLVLFFWPAALYMKIKDMRERGPGGAFEEKVFKVAKGDLLLRQTIEQIECSEIIEDPLGAVPALPFGHLNKCWTDLLAQLQAGDELCSFRSTWDGNWGRSEIRCGYVLVRDGSPDAYVLTETIPVEKADKE